MIGFTCKQQGKASHTPCHLQTPTHTACSNKCTFDTSQQVPANTRSAVSLHLFGSAAEGSAGCQKAGMCVACSLQNRQIVLMQCKCLPCGLQMLHSWDWFLKGAHHGPQQAQARVPFKTGLMGQDAPKEAQGRLRAQQGQRPPRADGKKQEGAPRACGTLMTRRPRAGHSPAL